MIGSGLKKLAKEHGMKVSHGVAYGSLGGYAATMSEGAGYKQIQFTTLFTSRQRMEELVEFCGRMNLSRRYRVQTFDVTMQGINVVFLDNPGTMSRIRDFVDWFLPILSAHAAAPVEICNECGGQIDHGKWVLIEGVAYHMHESCANKAAEEIDLGNVQQAEQATGSYGLGLLGAALGAALGAVVWAVVLNMGYVASIVGLLIGWLAEKGYNLLHGKQGKGKVWILILAVILGVLLGTVAADVFTLATMIAGGELPGIVMSDIPNLMILMLTQEAEYRAATISNIATGLLFAALGVFALLRKTSKDVSGVKYAVLE